MKLFFDGFLKRATGDLNYREAYLEPSQTSKMEFFVKIVNNLNFLTVFTKSSSQMFN